MKVLCKNNLYVIEHEFETVFLRNRSNGSFVCIGDFYGDPTDAIIDTDNRFCAVCGCGIIVYYIKKPFLSYQYHKSTSQWQEFFRSEQLYFESLRQKSQNEIIAVSEYGEEMHIAISHELLP